MSEKFRKVVNAPHRALARLREKIENAHPHNRAGRTAQVMGIGTAGLFQFLLWATKYVALDNHILRGAEEMLAEMKVGKDKSGNDKKLSAFMKKNPNLSAHILYYLMFTMIIGGGKVANEYGPVAVQNYKEWQADRAEREAKRGTYAEFLDKMQSITPFLIADLIAKEGVHVDSKTGLHTPYKDSRGIWTIGFGSTKLKDGTSVTKNTAPITNDEAYELARWHLENEETYFIMYCYDTAIDSANIDNTAQALGMGSIMYNTYSKLVENKDDRNHRERFAHLRDDFKQYGFAIPDSLVRGRFAEFPIRDETSFGRAWLHGESNRNVADKLGNFLAGGGGIRWRRWMEAGLLTGEITPQMLLDCPVNGMYEFYKCMGQRKDAFFIGDNDTTRQVNYETYANLRQWLQNPVNEQGQSLAKWKRVKDFMPADVVALCENEKCEFGNTALAQRNREISMDTNLNKNTEVKTYVLGYDEMYTVAVRTYRDGDYDDAAKKYNEIVAKYPDNALVRNDLAAAYNRLGQYDDAIAQVRDITRRIGDKKQYGSAYYNAGVAYEKKGSLQKALANYKLALANGNRDAQSAITRVTHAIQKDNSHRDKKLSFDAARHSIKKSVYAPEYAAYNNLTEYESRG